jgi:hypothetical protein
VLSTDGGTIGAPSYTGQSAASTGQGSAGTTPPPAAASASTPTTTSSAANISAAASSAGASTLPPPPGTPAPATAPAPAPAAAAPASASEKSTSEKEKATKTPTPKPAVTAKFTERPDEVDTGNDAQFEVETNVKKGSCSLTVTYRSGPETPIGGKNIDDGKCEWKYTLPADTKTGKAKAVVVVAAAEGTTTIEDTFEVKKGDTVFAGSVDLEVDPIDMPDGTVNPGEEIKIGVDTNLKRKGTCDLTMTWPKVGVVAGVSQMPDDSGKCAWKMKVPADAPRNSSANLLVTVRKDGSTVRTLSRDFKVAK